MATTANATTTGGGTPSAAYQINTGLDTIVSGTGWGAGLWGGTTAADPATTLNGALAADTAGTGGSGTSVVLTDASFSIFRIQLLPMAKKSSHTQAKPVTL